jgi:hypothetical protein
MEAINVIDRVRITEIKTKKLRRAVAAVEAMLVLHRLHASASLSTMVD